MKSVPLVFLLVTMLSLALAVTILAPPTLAPASQAGTIIVTSTADSGLGTLRQALLDAQSGDMITFDPTIFPPTSPITISVTSELPHIRQGDLTIDASNAGVILDGSNVPGDWETGLQIVVSNANTIRGLQISNFSGPGIAISGDATHNVIGGDRSLGSGPFGQGNQLIHNAIGVNLSTPGTTQNLITGNLMGTDDTGTASLGNERTGMWITESANGNTIGPDNVIAHNGQAGIFIYGPTSVNNTITRNSIHDNRVGIELQVGANTKLIFPSILDFDLPAGTVTGATCANCMVEIFSDAGYEGAIYEGQTAADGSGVFTFDKGAAFIGPHLTATTTDLNGNTSPLLSACVGYEQIFEPSTGEQSGKNPTPTQAIGRTRRQSYGYGGRLSEKGRRS
jgi:hypothetical protein